MKNSNNNIERRLPEKESGIKIAEERDDRSFSDFLRSKVRVTKANGGLLSNYKIESRKP